MELVIQGRNLELNDNLRSHLSRKLQRIDRHIHGIILANVELSLERTRRVDQRISAQITLDINGTMLRSEERAASTTAAIDAVVDVLDRRVQRLKGRLYRSEQAKKSGKNVSIRYLDAGASQPEPDSPSTEIVTGEGKVVRLKRYPIKPMKVEEATFQMELLGHDFFLFFNNEDQQYNVLYRRKDSDYGLIQPEMS